MEEGREEGEGRGRRGTIVAVGWLLVVGFGLVGWFNAGVGLGSRVLESRGIYASPFAQAADDAGSESRRADESIE